MNYRDLTEQLGKLYNNQHGNHCDSGTCSMSKAWSAGYDLIAIEQFLQVVVRDRVNSTACIKC